MLNKSFNKSYNSIKKKKETWINSNVKCHKIIIILKSNKFFNSKKKLSD